MLILHRFPQIAAASIIRFDHQPLPRRQPRGAELCQLGIRRGADELREPALRRSVSFAAAHHRHCGRSQSATVADHLEAGVPVVTLRAGLWDHHGNVIQQVGGRNGACMVAMDKATGKIWETEHGPRGGDEVNIIEPGKNYGWPAISYGINYNGKIITDKTALPGMEQPLLYWIPSIAPSGTAFVEGDKYKSNNNRCCGYCAEALGYYRAPN